MVAMSYFQRSKRYASASAGVKEYFLVRWHPGVTEHPYGLPNIVMSYAIVTEDVRGLRFTVPKREEPPGEPSHRESEPLSRSGSALRPLGHRAKGYCRV